MARDRQRAKQRQAERRAARLADAEQPPGTPSPGGADAPAGDGTDGGRGSRDRRGIDRGPAPDDGRDGGGVAPGIEPDARADLAASAPPEDAGRSDTVLETPPPLPLLDDDADSDDGDVDGERTNARAADEGSEQSGGGRNKVIAFLIASWAELQRVQWPTRQQTTTLTGIVLGFVVIMGAYLGALDAIFSRLIQLVI